MSRFKALPYVILLGALFGSNLVLARYLLTQFQPIVLNSLRLVTASILFLGIFIFSPNRKIPHGRRFWLHAGVYGIFGLAIPMTAYITSLEYQSSGVTALLNTLGPVVTGVLSQIFLPGEPFTLRKIAGSIVAFGGAGLILVRGESGLAGIAHADWRGYAWIILGVVMGSAGYIYARRFLANDDPIDVAGVRMITAALFLVPVAGLTAGIDFSRVTTLSWLGVGYSALFGTFSAFLLEFFILKKFGAIATTQASYVIPVVATTLGFLLLREQVTFTMLGGMGAIFAGLALLN
jgi:drug/metabolite transporter (DMT)-like permease